MRVWRVGKGKGGKASLLDWIGLESLGYDGEEVGLGGRDVFERFVLGVLGREEKMGSLG